MRLPTFTTEERVVRALSSLKAARFETSASSGFEDCAARSSHRGRQKALWRRRGRQRNPGGAGHAQFCLSGPSRNLHPEISSKFCGFETPITSSSKWRVDQCWSLEGQTDSLPGVVPHFPFFGITWGNRRITKGNNFPASTAFNCIGLFHIRTPEELVFMRVCGLSPVRVEWRT